MNVSRHFIVISTVLLLIGGALYYFFSYSEAFFDKARAENLTPVDTFLFTNYGTTLGLSKEEEEKARIYCDQEEASSTDGSTGMGYPCQNNNPTHKIIIGWADKNMSFASIAKSLSNEQLYFKMYPSTDRLDGTLSCSEADDYKAYQGGVSDLDCLLVTTQAEKLYSSTLFFKEKNTGLTLFVSILNTSKKSSPQKVKQELHALLAGVRRTQLASSYLDDIFTKRDEGEGVTEATSSTVFSTESGNPIQSRSANLVTQESGSGIDATVCDLSDTESCYPLYCLSATDVFNFSLNKCVTPSIAPVGSEESCPLDTPIWDGTKCRALTGNLISSNSCSIPVGGSSCSMKIFWSVEKPKNAISVKQVISPTESLIIGEGQSSTIDHTFNYQTSPYKVALYDGPEKIGEGSFTTKCSRGGWDDISKTCVDPNVTSSTIVGEYYKSPGLFDFKCGDSDRYIVRGDNDLIVASGTYSGETSIPLNRSGNYSVVCIKGNFTGSGEVKYYNAPPPPPPSMSFNAIPRTIGQGETTTLMWSITFPEDTCMIDAKIVCKPSGCTSDELNMESQLNQVLLNEDTDDNDPEGKRKMTTALQQITGDHVDNDFLTSGQKTLSLTQTADFTLHCGYGVPDIKKRIYIRTNK